MQRLRAHRPQVVAPRHQAVAPGRQRRARLGGQVEREEHARAGAAQRSKPSPLSTRRSRCRATVVERSRTSARSPGRRTSRTSLRPVGELHRPADVPDRLRLGSAAGPRHARDRHGRVGLEARQGAVRHRLRHLERDRPVALDQRRVHAEQLGLGLVRVAHDAAGEVLRRPGPLGQARGQQAPGARLRTAAQRPDSSSATWSSMVEPSTENRERSWRSRDQLAHRVPGRLRRRLPARHDLDLRPPQAGRDLELREALDGALGDAQRLGDLRLRDAEQPQRLLAVLRPPADRLLEEAGLHRLRPHRVQLARRSREHDDRRLAGHHQARRRARRVDHVRPLRDHRLLAVGGPHRVEVEVGEALHQRAQDVRDALLEVLVERQRAAGEARRPSRSSCRPRSGPARRW